MRACEVWPSALSATFSASIWQELVALGIIDGKLVEALDQGVQLEADSLPADLVGAEVLHSGIPHGGLPTSIEMKDRHFTHWRFNKGLRFWESGHHLCTRGGKPHSQIVGESDISRLLGPLVISKIQRVHSRKNYDEKQQQ
jgi:hypothetical protein